MRRTSLSRASRSAYPPLTVVDGADSQAVKRCERVYLESYTSILMISKEKLEAFYGREVITATREMVELESDEMVRNADKVDVAFLVVGDPLGATTHTDLLLRCSQLNIPTTTIHNASILTALGSTGLQMYNFGQTLSLVFYTETWTPQSWYDRLEENLRIGMHTLILVDIKVREQSEENMARCAVSLVLR
jgi:diphthine synthase